MDLGSRSGDRCSRPSDTAEGLLFSVARALYRSNCPPATSCNLRRWGVQEQLAAETARLDLAGAVNWAGFSSNPFPTIRAANAYVMPSLWEGFPVALLEAMALEQAVIATDCPGASSEMLRGGKSGLLVPSRDPAALAEAILAVVSDPALRRDLGARARKRAGEYSAEEVFHRYHTVMLGTLE